MKANLGYCGGLIRNSPSHSGIIYLNAWSLGVTLFERVYVLFLVGVSVVLLKEVS